MKQYRCGQRGCLFESEHHPDECPVCRNPYIAGQVEIDQPAPGEQNDPNVFTDPDATIDPTQDSGPKVDTDPNVGGA